MRIDKLKIQNFKGFAEAEFEFPSNFTVLIGKNATGKTSILDALAVAMGGFLEDIKVKDQQRIILLSEIYTKTYIEALIEPQLPVIIDVRGFWIDSDYKKNDINWSRKRKEVYINGTTFFADFKNLQKYTNWLLQGISKGEKIIAPIISYFSTTRLWTQQQTYNVDFQSNGSRLRGYEDCLSTEPNKLDYLNWIKTYEAQISILERNKVDATKEIALLNAVKNALSTCFEDWTNIYFDLLNNDLVGTIKLPSGETSKLSLKMLSDGQRNIAMMVLEIAYRCVILNPHLGENAVKESSGIILIDELDMHLHPTWQRRVVDDLKRTFPNIQFVATTHSPFIVQSMKSKEVFNLDKNKWEENPSVLALEDIADTIMGMENQLRSKKFQEMEEVASQYFTLIQQGKNSKNSKEVAELKAKLDELESMYSQDAAYTALLKIERKAKGL